MPRVLTKKKNRAGGEKNCARCGRKINPGETYYTWSFRYGGTRYGCEDHYPRPSQLTQSKVGEILAAIESVEDSLDGYEHFEEIVEDVQGVGETAANVADEYREAAEAFGGEGENAERADMAEEFAGECENFYLEDPEGDKPTDDELEDARTLARETLGRCDL